MIESLESPVLFVLGALLLCASLYYALICFLARRFSRSEACRNTDFLPPVSILKPIHGLTPSFTENIRSHALQDYPEFELLFGVADVEAPSVESIRTLAREFPEKRIELVVCGSPRGGNAKVHCLEKLAAHARYDTLLVNDSDIRVGPDYLRQIVAPLADGQAGMVTCLYGARPGGTFWSLLEALWISAEFQAQVLAGRALQGMKFALGATMLFRQRDLLRIGGFGALQPFLADDYLLGNRLAGLGLSVSLSPYTVETVLPPEPARGVWRRLLRWSRTIRVSRPMGHASLIVTQGTVWSLLGLAAGSSGLVFPALALVCLALRLAAAWRVGWGCLGSALVRRRLYLLPLADLLAFFVWCGSFFGNQVYWGGHLFRLNRRGEMLPVADTTPESRPRRPPEQDDDAGWVHSPSSLKPARIKETR